MPNPERREKISEIVLSLRKIFKAIHDYSREALRAYGMTGPQLWAMRTLEERGELPIGDLARRMYLHPSTVTGIVSRLESRGFMARVRSREDQRSVIVSLTDEGRRILEGAPHPAQGKLLYGLETLGEEQIVAIQNALNQLVEIMEVGDVEATFFFGDE